jgi:hypothetical protein
VADAGTNVLLWSQDPSNAVWTKTGPPTLTQDLIGADGVINSGWTIDGLMSGVFLFDVATGLTISSRYEPSIVLKQIATTGVFSISNPFGIGFGRWFIDASMLSTSWETVTRDHPAVTVDTEFTSNVSGQSGVLIGWSSGDASSIGFFNAQLEEGTISTPQKYTEAGTTSTDADINTTITPQVLLGATWAFEGRFTPAASGLTGTVMASYTDANNYTEVSITTNSIILNKRVGGTDHEATFAYTHVVDTEAWYQIYGSVTGIGIRASHASADITLQSFDTDADTDLAVWASLIGWGHLDGGNVLPQEVTNNGYPIARQSKESAGWS